MFQKTMKAKQIFFIVLFFMNQWYSLAQTSNCCVGRIVVSADYGCPNVVLGDVFLTAFSGTMLPSNQFTYHWSPQVGLNTYQSQTVKLMDTVSRTYTVLIRNIIDTSMFCIDTIVVNRPNSNLPTFNAKDTVVCQNETVNIGNLAITGQTYYWINHQDKISNINSSRPSVVASQSDIYILRITDNGSGCYVFDTSTVNARIVLAEAGANRTICSNAVIRLGAGSNIANQIYKWSPSNSNWQNSTDSSFKRPDVLVATNTTFIILAIDTLTGCEKRDTIDVIVNNSPTIPNFPDTAICIGSTIGIGTTTQVGVSYTWTPIAGLSCTSCSFTYATPTVTRTYYLTAIYPGSCSSNPTDSVRIVVRNPAFTMPDINYCTSNGAFALGTSAPSSMSSYSWSPTSLVSSANTAATNTLNPPPSIRTSFTLTVRDANGCSASDVFDIIPTMVAPIAGNNQSICLNEGSTTIGSSSNASGFGISYSWSPATGLSSFTSTNPVFTFTATGTYNFTLTKTDANISCSNSANVTVVVKDFKLPAMTNPIICSNGFVEIGTQALSGAEYFWSPSTGLSDSVGAKVTASPTNTTIYKLKSIGSNSCSDEQYVSVTVSNDSVPQITIPSIDACLEDVFDTVQVTISPNSNNYQYFWSGTDAFIRNVDEKNALVNLNVIGNRTYNLNVTNSSNGCQSNADLFVQVEYCPLNAESIQMHVNCLNNTIEINGLQDWFQNYQLETSKNGVDFIKLQEFEYRKTQQNGICVLNINSSTMNEIKYFRISAYDLNQNINILSVKDNDCFESGFSVNLYPNPSQEVSTVEVFNTKQEFYKVSVFNYLGQMVYESGFSKINRIEINTKDFNSGTYWVMVQSKTGIRKIKKLVVVKG